MWPAACLGGVPPVTLHFSPDFASCVAVFAGRSERRGWLSAVTAPAASRYLRRSAAPHGIVLIGATPRRRIEAPRAALCDMPRFNDQNSGMIERQRCARSPKRMSNINTKRIMLRLAEDYDKFSDRAAEARRPPSLGIAAYSTHKTAKRQFAFDNRAASLAEPLGREHGRLENTAAGVLSRAEDSEPRF